MDWGEGRAGAWGEGRVHGRAGAHLGLGAAQRAAEEGEHHVEDAAPGVQVVAVLVAHALPQEPEQPLPLGAVLWRRLSRSEPRRHLHSAWTGGTRHPGSGLRS